MRQADPSDAESLLTIYAPIVETTAISFEAEPPTPEDFAQRIERGLRRYPWLLAERGGSVLGYAYAGSFRGRHAYRATAEVTIYTAPLGRRRGLGRALYSALFESLRACRIHSAVAAIARPNAISEAFHLALGFEPAGVVPRAGYKLGDWHDVAFFTLQLQQDDEFREPIAWSELPPGDRSRLLRAHALPHRE